MRTRLLSLILLFVLWPMVGKGQEPRQVITLNDGWAIRPITTVDRKAPFTPVVLPHTWNAEPQPGTTLYERKTMVYQRPLTVDEQLAGRRLFLLFEGVNSVAQVFVNGRTVGEHRGGYTAFCFEITPYVHEGDNQLEVWASNAYRTDVLPISGDFNVNGGIHRPVHLIATSSECISPVYYGSSGVLIHQESVDEAEARLYIETHLLVNGEQRAVNNEGLRIVLSLEDADGTEVAKAEGAAVDSVVNIAMQVNRPHLWDGKADPYLYTLRAQLCNTAGEVLDEVSQRTGFRYFSADPDRGFFLNGHSLDLHGFCRHDDAPGRASALLPEDYQRDMDLIEEVGATAMRLAHYPHGGPMYELSDEHGIILWTELPLCGPGGMSYTGYVDTPGLKGNARQVLHELVSQRINHPSVCFWGVSNEILVSDGGRFHAYDDPIPFLHELSDLFHALDPSRPTALATCVDQQYYLGATDLLAWNKYFGWYSDAAPSVGKFFDQCHAQAGVVPIGVSEYGAGASPNHHQWPLDNSDRADSHFHPEEAQAYCHEGNLDALRTRDYLWAKFIWVFADFPSYMRHEGDADGYNDKGLITRDRQTRKDAFYLYKANWTTEPMLHLTSKRFTQRTRPTTDVKVYTNLPQSTLYINGRKVGTAKADDIGRIIWADISLQEGSNLVRVEAKQGKNLLSDEAEWTVKSEH